MSESAITFHFDFISPYAYLAWTQIDAIAKRYGRTVAPVPTLLAALLAHGATKGPAEIPAKRAYLFVDTLRTARVLGVPFGPPASHPFNPLLALRVASLEASTDELHRRVDALFTATWARGEAVDTEEGVARVLDAAGFDGKALAARGTTPDAKERLRAQTDAAIAHGVFGVPTMLADGAMFWGVDSLPHLERHLRGERIDVRAEMAKWSSVRPTASRRV